MIERRPIVPRVSLPDVDPEAVERLQAMLAKAEAHESFLRDQKDGLAAAMFRLKKPVARRTRRKARPTPNVLHHARMAARSAFLKEISA